MQNNEIISLIEKDENIIKADKLSDENKKEILKLEMKRLEETIPLINKALKEALDKKYAIIIFKDASNIIIDKEDMIPTLTLENENGTIIGEEIYDEEELEELQNDPTTYFMSENFVTYTNLSVPGLKEFFVISEIYNELECEKILKKKVKDMILSEPSTQADKYIKKQYNITNENINTLILGYNV